MLCDRHRRSHDSVPLLPGCPFWCLVWFLPAATWHPLRDGLPHRTPTTPAIGEITGMYRRGDLAGFPGLGPRRLAEIGHCLTSAGLLPRADAR